MKQEDSGFQPRRLEAICLRSEDTFVFGFPLPLGPSARVEGMNQRKNCSGLESPCPIRMQMDRESRMATPLEMRKHKQISEATEIVSSEEVTTQSLHVYIDR